MTDNTIKCKKCKKEYENKADPSPCPHCSATRSQQSETGDMFSGDMFGRKESSNPGDLLGGDMFKGKKGDKSGGMFPGMGNVKGEDLLSLGSIGKKGDKSGGMFPGMGNIKGEDLLSLGSINKEKNKKSSDQGMLTLPKNAGKGMFDFGNPADILNLNILKKKEAKPEEEKTTESKTDGKTNKDTEDTTNKN